MHPWTDKILKYNVQGRPTTLNEKAKLPVISSDTDGVTANWVDGFLAVFNKKYGKNITHDQWVNDQPWKIEDPWITKEQFEECFDATLKIPEFYLHLKPYANVDFKQINKDLDKALYNYYAVTVRVNLLAKEGITDTTQLLSRWIRAQGVVSVSGCNAGSEDRPSLLEHLGVDFHLDDFIKQVKAINKHGKTKAFLMDRPWNQQYDVGDLRVYSFEEFLHKSAFNKEVEARTE